MSSVRRAERRTVLGESTTLSGPEGVHRWVWPCALGTVGALAFVVRLLQLVRGGGLAGSDGYDDSVYYAAATAVVHGRLPYRDFVLLHPPGLIVALAPFAELARVSSDRLGQDVARLSFMALGALNTVLVMRLGRRFGLVPGLFAGLLYAVSFPALYAERTTTLEALGNTTMLVGLTLLVRRARAHPDAGRRRHLPGWAWPTGRLVGAGVALGAGAGVKIWGVVPFVVIAGWVLLTAGRKAAGWFVAAGAATVIAICLPFFAQAPAVMVRYVVVDQLRRPRDRDTIVQRLTSMAGLQAAGHQLPLAVLQPATGVVVVLVVAAGVTALRQPGARIFVALLVAQAALLLASPTSYLHYDAVIAAPGALVLGVGAGALLRVVDSKGHHGALGACLVMSLTLVLAYGMPGIVQAKGKPLSISLARAAMHTPGCITADDPTYLIAMNVLSRDLDHGCQVWIDLTGLSYDRDSGVGEEGRLGTDRVWQHKVMSYLLSGDATMVARKATQLDAASRAQIDELPVITSARGFTLRRVR